MAYKEVEWLFQRDVEETYNITVGGEVITTTDEHPFWIVGKGWVEAQHLAVGDVLTTSDGKELAIEKIEVKKEHKTVYNFKVKDFHTYFVSNLGIWTHNSCSINLKGSYSDAYTVRLQSTYNQFMEAGVDVTEHGLNRVLGRASRGVTIENTISTFKNGKIYFDPDNNTMIRFKDGIAVSYDKTTSQIVNVQTQNKPTGRWIEQ